MKMNTCSRTLVTAVFVFSVAGATFAADVSVAGKWKSQFDSQIGQQKYTFEFKVDGDKLTGKAIGEREMGTNEVTITEGKIDKDKISFVEPLKLDDNEIRIEYKGTVAGDEIKLHRKVGDFAEYDIVAKRVKDADMKAGSKTEKSEPASKP